MAQRDPGQAESFLEENLGLVEQVLRRIAKKRRLSRDELEELRSVVFLKLIEDDYAVIRQFRADSSFRTFLLVVVTRALLDERASKWGKWRPSKVALRLGSEALALEQLVYRDGWTWEEACESLRRNEQMAIPADRLKIIAQSLPRRTRRVAGSLEAQELTSKDRADSGLVGRQRLRLRQRVEEHLRRLLLSQSPEDQSILDLRFRKGYSVARIAREVNLEQRPLYRRIARCLRSIRRGLESKGITRSTIGDLQFDD